MSSSQAHLEFAPTPESGNGRALALAVGVHALLLLALNWGTLWSQQPQDMSVEAELWSAIPQPVAAKVEAPQTPVEPTPPEPQPEPEPLPAAKPTPAVTPVTDPQIAIDKLKKQKAEEKQRAQDEKKAKLKAEKEEEDKRKAKEKQEAKEAEARHQAAVKRLQSMAGSVGTPVDTGVAPKPSGPSASYIGRLRGKVKPNITFPDALLQTVVGNPTADVEVTCSPSGKIEDVTLVKSSGNKAWDDAVINGLRKTEILPRDVDGSVPTRLVFSFRPRD
jgi:colicin import membrane protein